MASPALLVLEEPDVYFSGSKPSACQSSSGAGAFLDQFRDYRLLETLGQGGMGTVFKALHTRLDKIVALKVLPSDRLRDPQVVTRFEREMKAVGKLEHRRIERALDAGVENGKHYLVMEHVEGIDLAELSRQLGLAEKQIRTMRFLVKPGAKGGDVEVGMQDVSYPLR